MKWRLKLILALAGVLFILIPVLFAFQAPSGSGPDPSATALPENIPPDGYHRIISLSPGTTEILFALGAEDRVAGVTRFCTWPVEAANLPRVGGFTDPDYEAMVRLEPDMLVLLPWHREYMRHFDTLGMRYIMVDTTDVTGIQDAIEKLGRICGIPPEKNTLADELEKRISLIAEQASGLKPVRVMLSTGRDFSAGFGQVFIAGRNTFLDNLIELAGGVNAFEDTTIEYPSLSSEGLLQLDPDVIVELIPDLAATGRSESEYIASWDALPHLSAVKSGRVHVISGDYVMIPGPRIILTLEKLAAVLHPGRIEIPEKTPEFLIRK